MFNLIPQIILFLALGVIVAIIIKNIPKVKDFNEPDEAGNDFFVKQKKILDKIPVEKINDQVNNVLEKTLRRMKIGISKVDTLIQKNLNSIKDNNKPKSIFKVENEEGANLEGDLTESVPEKTSEAFIPESSFDVVDIHEKITIDNNEVVNLNSSEAKIEEKSKRGRKKKQSVL